MKAKLTLISLLAMFLLCCQSENKKVADQKKVNTAEKKVAAAAEKEKLLVLPWKAEYNPQTQKLELKYNTTSNSSNLTVQDMIDALNLKYPDIKLQNKGLIKDTLTVGIADAAYLTQQSGTTGAETFLAEATFALTELKNVKAVNFEFKEGDHATPKTYSRKDFQDFN